MTRSAVPRIVGVIAIIWAILGFLGGCSGGCTVVSLGWLATSGGASITQGIESGIAQEQARKRQLLAAMDADIARLSAGGALPAGEAKVGGVLRDEKGNQINGGDEKYEYDREDLESATTARAHVAEDIATVDRALAAGMPLKVRGMVDEMTSLGLLIAGFFAVDGILFSVVLLVAGIGLVAYKGWSLAVASLGWVLKAVINVGFLGVLLWLVPARVEEIARQAKEMEAQGEEAATADAVAATREVDERRKQIEEALAPFTLFGLFWVVVPVVCLVLLLLPASREALASNILKRHDGTEFRRSDEA